MGTWSCALADSLEIVGGIEHRPARAIDDVAGLQIPLGDATTSVTRPYLA